jgi:hypothetical protein
MKRQDAAAAGYAAGATLPPLGRAARFAAGPGQELFRLPAADEAVGARLRKLGDANVGGFVDGGLDAEGVWLVRITGGALLGEILRDRKGPWPWREAIAIAIAIARALAACEASSLFPGPLTPDAVRVIPSSTDGTKNGAVLTATTLVGALLGARDAAGTRQAGDLSPRWTPPAQADGAAWDNAANRYTLGLLLYRLLSGEHPFEGAGLRHALGEAAHREVAPFAPKVAATLPSGLQSLTLRLLDPVVVERPAQAAAIAEDLAAFVSGEAAKTAASPLPVAPRRGEASMLERPSRPATSARRSARSWAAPSTAGTPAPASKGFRRFVPIGAGAAIALGSLALLAPAKDRPPPAKVPEQAPIAAAQTAATDCAACHARQAAEWRRSVMAHAVKSPLFNALESLIEEQIGRDDTCPGGAGILRRVDLRTACRDPKSGLPVTGSGGEHWCVNCHSPMEKLEAPLPPWEGRADGDPRSRRPVRDLLKGRAMEGISCGFCHEVHGPVGGQGARGYQGNATWTSFVTGATFSARPEDARGLFGIGNSGYDLRPEDFLLARAGRAPDPNRQDPLVHLRPPGGAKAYLRSSEFCGSCHDVRLFGTDSLGASRGDRFKRLRNAYSEWALFAKAEERKGKTAATCQGCHMSAYPGVCVPDRDGQDGGEKDPACPSGTHLSARAPGAWPKGRAADNSAALTDVTTHYFSGVDVPLSREFPTELIDEPTVDLHGIPLSARRRRDLLLRHTFRFGLGATTRGGAGLEIPIEIENIGAGHRVPAGFSQEREFWVHLVVRDGDGRVLYEVGRVDRSDEDLHDKVFLRVNTNGAALDNNGRPEGLFGADVRDGPDVPSFQPSPLFGGTSFRGKGLINFQNGFLRCVRCIGTIGPDGRCEALAGQNEHRGARFADGDYDLDTGECRSNLTGSNAFFETYFPVGALDASRGIVKGPDAIIDTRSVPPGVPIRYTYDLATSGRRGPFRIEARLLFRAFPPFLIRGFAEYEREQARRGLRPSGPLVTADMLARLEVVELARATAEVR